MRRGFWQGLLAGGMIGAAVGIAMAPQWRPAAQRATIHAADMGKSMGTMVEGRARRMWRRARVKTSMMGRDLMN